MRNNALSVTGISFPNIPKIYDLCLIVIFFIDTQLNLTEKLP